MGWLWQTSLYFHATCLHPNICLRVQRHKPQKSCSALITSCGIGRCGALWEAHEQAKMINLWKGAQQDAVPGARTSIFSHVLWSCLPVYTPNKGRLKECWGPCLRLACTPAWDWMAVWNAWRKLQDSWLILTLHRCATTGASTNGIKRRLQVSITLQLRGDAPPKIWLQLL